MANKIVSLLLQVKNQLSPGVKEASADLGKLQSRAADLQRELKKLEYAKAAADSLGTMRDAAKGAEEGFNKAQLEVEKLKIALKTDKTPEMAVALVKARDAARDAKGEWKASEKEVKKLIAVISRAGGNIADMETTERMLAEQIEITNGALKKNSEELGKNGNSMNAAAESGERVGFSFKEIAVKAAALIGVVAIVDKLRSGLSNLARSVWETGNQFEQFSARLNAEEFGYIEEFVKTTPQGLDDVAEAFLRLKSFGMDPMNGTLQSLIDKNAQLGGNMESLQGIILQLGQGWTKQKLQANDLIPILERGVPVYDLLSEAMGKTAAEIQELASAGKLGRKEIQLLIDAMGASAVGEASKQMSMMTGIVATLRSQFTNFYKDIADAGAWEYLKAQLTELSGYIKQLSDSGELQRMAQAFSDGFITIAETVKSTVVTIYEMREVLGLLAQAWLALKVASWAGQLGNAAKGFAGMGAAATTATNAIRALAVAMKATIALAIIQGVWEVASAYKNLRIEVNKLDQAKRAEAESSSQLAARYREISESTGITVSSMKELEYAIAEGTIVIDEQTGKYLSASQAAAKYAKSVAEMSEEAMAAAERNKRITASLDEVRGALEESGDDAKKLAKALGPILKEASEEGKYSVEELTEAIYIVGLQSKDTAKKIREGVHKAIKDMNDDELSAFGDAIEKSMIKASDGTDKAGRKIKELQALMDSVNTNKLERAFKTLGVVSQAELAKIAAAAKEAFDRIVESGAPIEDQKKAFIAYAKAAVDANKAVSESQRLAVVEQLKTVAATLGMKQQLEEILTIQQKVGKEGKESGEKIRKGADRGTEGMKELKEATEEVGNTAGGMGAALAEIFNKTRANLAELSEAAAALFDKRMGINTSGPVSEIEALNLAIEATNEKLGETRHRAVASFDITGIGRYISKLSEVSQATRLEFQQQQLSALRLTEALNNTGNVTAATITRAQNAISQLKLLGNEDLSTLRSALDSANSKLKSMNDNAKSTLDNLKNELDRLQENQDAIDKRDYENKKKQLQDAIDDARKMGNQEAVRSYTESLKILEQVRQEREKQNRTAAAEKAQREREARQPQQPKSTPQSSKTVDINLNLGDKNAAFTAHSQSDATALIDLLEKVGRTTL